MPRFSGVLLAVSAGFLLAGSFPPFDFYPLAWIALIPLFYALQTRKKWEGAFLVFFAMLIFFLEYLHWISVFGWYAWLLSACYESLFPAVWGFAAASFFSCAKFSGFSVFFPAVSYAAMEAVRNLGSFAMPWGDLAYTQWKFPLFLQVASLTGGLGITFFLVLINTLLYLSLKERKRKWVAGVFLCFFLPGIFGVVRLRTEFSPKIPIALLQTNDVQLNKWDRSYYRLMLSTMSGMARQASRYHPKLILFPETAFPDNFESSSFLQNFVRNLALQTKSWLGVGTITVQENFPQNTIILVKPDGTWNQKYAKVKLVPFGEYLPFFLRPFRKRWRVLSPIVDFKPGNSFSAFSMGEEKFGCMICFESSFGWIARKLVQSGADFLAVSTNDAWFDGTPAQEVHAIMAVYRSVETGRSCVQVGNTGISCVVDPRGRILAWRKPEMQSIVLAKIPVSHETTFYDHWGDVFPYVCILLTLGWAGRNLVRHANLYDL